LKFIYACGGALSVIIKSIAEKALEYAAEKVVEIVADIFGFGVITILKTAWYAFWALWHFGKGIYYQVKKKEAEYSENYGKALGYAIKCVLAILKIGRRRKQLRRNSQVQVLEVMKVAILLHLKFHLPL